MSFLPIDWLVCNSLMRRLVRLNHLSHGSGSSLIFREVLCICLIRSIFGVLPRWKGGTPTMAMTDFPWTSLISGGSVILNPLLWRVIVNTPSCISLLMLGLVTSNSIWAIPLTVYGWFLVRGWLTCCAPPIQPATHGPGSRHSSFRLVLILGKAKIT